MKKKLITLCLMATLTGGIAFAQTRVIAHRGYWDCEGSAQNSIAALQEAAKAGAYGSEFDVLITADGVPVVNHDDVFQGFLIEESDYEQVKELKLPNGETLPTLEQYLLAGKNLPDTQLILEIKPHKRTVNEDRAVAAVIALVKKHQLESQVEYISFSMNICKELIRQAPGAPVFYLTGNVSPKDLKTLGMAGLDYHYSVIQKNPEWIEECKELGLKSNVWTVNDPAIMKEMIGLGVDFITTDKPAELKKLAAQ